MKYNANISLQFKGKTQADRLLPELASDTFQIDDRNSLDLLAFTTKFAKAFKYYNPQNKIDGSWQELLLDDPSMLLAYIIKTNYYLEFPRYLDYNDGINATQNLSTKCLFAQQYFAIGFHVILRINRWYKLTNKSLSHHDFRDYLYELIAAEGRQALEEYYLIYFKLIEWVSCCTNQSLTRLEALDKVWLFHPFPCIEKRNTNINDENLLDSLVAEAVKSGQKLFHLQEKIIQKANIFFEESIKRNNVSPHIGLLLTFLDLFKHQQNDLNQLTEHHLDFYFNSVLGFKTLPAISDTTHVQLTKGNRAFVLPKETSLSAGNDSKGNPIIFSTKKTISITKSELSQYLTLSLVFNKNKKFENLNIGSVEKFTTLSALSWPFFGDAKPIKSNTKSPNPNYKIKTEKETLGFAISCPELILNSGKRSITFTFLNKEIPIDQFLNLQTNNTTLFNFQLTIATGWQKFEGQCVSITSDFVKFKLKLLTSDPAIVPYDEKIHKAELKIKQAWPVCKITLAEGALYDDFKKLSNFDFTNILVNCNVNGAQSLVLQNDHGKVSPKTPFYPFGNAPFPEANLFIGGQEFFIKPLNTIKFNILWNHLPDNFEAYYQAYPSIYNNQIFKGSLSSFDTNSQTWKTINISDDEINEDSKDPNKKVRFSLFTADQLNKTKKDNIPSPLFQQRSISFSTKTIPAQPDLPKILKYSQKQSNSFFKLTLVEPSQGFGTAEYSQLLSKITLENGQAIIWNAKNCTDTNVCKILEVLYNTISSFKDLEIQFKNEIGKLDKILILLKDCADEVTEINSNCGSDQIKTNLVEEVLKNYVDKIQKIITNYDVNILQIVDEASKIYEDLIKKVNIFFVKETTKIIDYLDKLIDFIIDDFEKIKSSEPKQFLKNAEEKILDELKDLITPNKSIFGKIKNFFTKKNTAVPNEEDASSSKEGKTKLLNLLKKLDIIKGQIVTEYNKVLGKISTKDITTELQKNKSQLNKWVENVSKKVKEFEKDRTLFISMVSTKNNSFNHLLELIPIKYISLKPLPNKPFIPKIKKLSVDYKSSSQWKSTDGKSNPVLDFQFFHIEPFGNKEITIDTPSIKIFPNYEHTSYAFLGLEKLSPGETLTILLNITSQVKVMTSSSSNKVNYEYLSSNSWKTLTLYADHTYDLEQSGIIQFVVPSDMTDQSTIMPKNIFWIRVAEPFDRINKAEVMTNFVGMHAVPVQRNIDIQTDLQQIKAGIIKSTVNSNSAIKNIQQPIPSFGGRPAETKKQSFQRAAYRLNNKNRAVTLGDMENLILQSFGNLYQAIAVPMKHYNQNQNNILKVAIIPFTEANGDHPYRPLVLPAMMRKVLEFSKKYCPPSMELKIVNPDFISIKITVAVKFNDQNDIGLLAKKLNSDLIIYLSPWLKDNPFIAEQSNAKNLAALNAFILSRPYVEQVGNIKYDLSEENSAEPVSEKKLLPWNLIVPAFEHSITNINATIELNKNYKDLKIPSSTSSVNN
ncbi:MAG: hypothetical protein AB8H03_11125 [Saprospiraceae bacterium]